MQKFFNFLIFILILFSLSACGKGFFKRSDIKDNPVNVDDRVRKNLEEGRGIRFGNPLDQSGGTFDFASSNELWRASVEILDFVPLTNASYSGGIIITDWFRGNNEDNENRQLKITVRFLSNQIRADALNINIHEKICEQNFNNCKTSLIKSKVSEEIKLAILKKATLLRKTDWKKRDKVDRSNQTISYPD